MGIQRPQKSRSQCRTASGLSLNQRNQGLLHQDTSHLLIQTSTRQSLTSKKNWRNMEFPKPRRREAKGLIAHCQRPHCLRVGQSGPRIASNNCRMACASAAEASIHAGVWDNLGPRPVTDHFPARLPRAVAPAVKAFGEMAGNVGGIARRQTAIWAGIHKHFAALYAFYRLYHHHRLACRAKRGPWAEREITRGCAGVEYGKPGMPNSGARVAFLRHVCGKTKAGSEASEAGAPVSAPRCAQRPCNGSIPVPVLRNGHGGGCYAQQYRDVR